MKFQKQAMAGLYLATSLFTAHALAADDSAHKHDTGVHTEIRDGANETPESNKGKGGGLLDMGPVKQRAEDQKPGKSEKKYENQYETDRTKKKGEGQ
ncbi:MULTISPECIES: hypothetical protein [Pseudomonas]|uniref:hypothetical protein n=1 Tax=Pseudomonas TaxID=286 RepID=UPI00058DC743|nr:hypothetical protein [Pseudomonas massiliensis]